ncbi:MAG: GNAT family N-acetyltransferase [Bacteroidia bacterium]|nr:GNAT family N-acetyltransferase [Bacteroidia bacterium]
MEIFIRQISTGDASAITVLTQQLGYPMSIEQIQINVNAVMNSENDDAFVAVLDNKVIGWIGVALSVQIELLAYCVIRGLVVDDNYRNLGVGKLLIEKAKQWGKEKENDKLRLRCNVIRTETHLFYQHLGFTETKQQKVFEINI